LAPEPSPTKHSSFNLYIQTNQTLNELALLVEAGFTPAEALRAATLNPASFFALSDSLPTIEVGEIADLVLLEADPIQNIRNTTHIAAVIQTERLVRGEWRAMRK
jgi:imidazolonepropionase-like amidohydrolase